MTDFPAADLRHDEDFAADGPHPGGAGASHDDTAADAAPAPPPSERGWTNAAQASFLEVLSGGSTVAVAAHFVGLARSSAYALRHRDPLFAKGWAAAELLARDSIAEVAASRAIDGYTEITEWSPDRLVRTRHRHDNRLLLATLTRLDHAAEASRTTRAGAEIRTIAADFAGFLTSLRAGSAEAAAHAARHRMSEAQMSEIEAARVILIKDIAVDGLAMREQRVHAGLPTTDLDAILDKLCAAIGEPRFDWGSATQADARARESDEILSAREQRAVFSSDEDNLARGQALAEAEAIGRAQAGPDALDCGLSPGAGEGDGTTGASREARPAPPRPAEPDKSAGIRPLCPVAAPAPPAPRREPRLRAV